MSGPVPDALAELIAMKASGEITSEEFTAARDRLRGERAQSAREQSASHSSVAGSGGATASQLSSANMVAAASKKPRRFRKTAAVIGISFVALWILGSFGAQTTYKRADYSAAWPYPAYDSATVRCTVKTFWSAP